MNDQKSPKVLVLGYGRHGKDTVADLLASNYGLVVCSTSLWAAKHIMMPFFEGQGVHYNSVEECYADRHTGDNRALWYETIKAYGSGDPSRFSREVLVDHDVFVGMRSSDELKASRHLYDYVCWVDASERGIPPEPKSSMTIERDHDMWVIDNNGSEDDLIEQVANFARFMKVPHIGVKAAA